jgi:hypothetical protein
MVVTAPSRNKLLLLISEPLPAANYVPPPERFSEAFSAGLGPSENCTESEVRNVRSQSGVHLRLIDYRDQ